MFVCLLSGVFLVLPPFGDNVGEILTVWFSVSLCFVWLEIYELPKKTEKNN